MPARTPSGWKWLLRCGLACAAVVLATGGAWLYWSYEADRRAQAMLADLRSKGRLLRWSDLQFDDVADAENAATCYKAAWAAYVPSPVFGMASVAPATRPAIGTPTWQTMAQAGIAANGNALALARKARQFDRVCWAKPTPGNSMPPIPQFPNVSSFCRVLQAAVILHHQQGDEKAAIESWRDIDHMTRMIGKDNFLLITGLIALINSDIGVDAALRIAPELRFQGPGALDPADARAWVRELLDTDPVKTAVVRGFRSEGTGWMNNVGSPPTVARMIRPGLVMVSVRSVATMNQMADEWENLDLSPSKVTPVLGQGVFHDFSTPMFGSPNDLVQGILRRRMAAISVAISLYNHENGHFPASLEAMVPSYLPSVPMDPRNQDKTPLGYLLLEDGRRPVICSPGNSGSVGQPPKARTSMLSGGNAIPTTGPAWHDADSPAR
jgi:hypothetical protein